MSQCYRIAGASVVSEVIDGEAIIMDIASGTYYSADGVGALIWQALIDGATKSDIVEWAEGCFADHVGRRTAVCDFIDDLVGCGLMLAVPAPEGVAQAVVPATCAYAPPRLHKHTDMQDLIAIDPIHDVDEVGWPVRKVEASR